MGKMCPNCGNILSDQAKFCPKCGTKQETQTRQEGKFCLFCGATLEPGARFCSSCGRDLMAAKKGNGGAVHSNVSAADPWSIAGNRLCLVSAFLCSWSGQNLWQFYRGKKTGTCIENFYTFCDCKRRSHVWTGADDGIIQYHTGSDQYDHADRRIWKYGRYCFTGRNHRSGRRLWIF